MAFTISNLFKGVSGTGPCNWLNVDRDDTGGFSFTLEDGLAYVRVEYRGSNDRTFIQKLKAKADRNWPLNGSIDPVESSTKAAQAIAGYAPLKAQGEPMDVVPFLLAFAYCEPAASNDATRYNLCSLYFENGATVATDGHRMHHAALGLPAAFKGTPVTGMLNIDLARMLVRGVMHNLTTHGVKTMQWAFSDEDGVLPGEKCPRFWFRTESASLTMEVAGKIEGQFPDYRQVIPSEENTLVRVTGNAAELHAALKGTPVKLSPKGREKFRTVRFTQDTMQTLDLDGITSVKSLPVKVESSKDRSDEQDLVIGFNDEYFQELVDHGGDFTMLLTDGLSPIVWRQGHCTGVLMPVKP